MKTMPLLNRTILNFFKTIKKRRGFDRGVSSDDDESGSESMNDSTGTCADTSKRKKK